MKVSWDDSSQCMEKHVPNHQPDINMDDISWLVVLNILKSISQWEGLSNILWKIKNA